MSFLPCPFLFNSDAIGTAGGLKSKSFVSGSYIVRVYPGSILHPALESIEMEDLNFYYADYSRLDLLAPLFNH